MEGGLGVNGANEPCDLSDDRLEVGVHLALPNTADRPSGFVELPVVLTVASLVAVDLPSPVVGSGLGRAVVVGTAMPEATVHEDGDTWPYEDEVGARSDDLAMLSVTEAPAPELATKAQLGSGVLAAHSAHDLGPLGGRERVVAGGRHEEGFNRRRTVYRLHGGA